MYETRDKSKPEMYADVFGRSGDYHEAATWAERMAQCLCRLALADGSEAIPESFTRALLKEFVEQAALSCLEKQLPFLSGLYFEQLINSQVVTVHDFRVAAEAIAKEAKTTRNMLFD